ncbi:MAG: tRNA uridine(34) 5-carboxymethylaminomethyl modification radical SAM/GNAT enzyme Elp3 [Nanoarchaeota archaeon]|nr:tRNA uridine(34) 5-carboxymethylaminomethyl modification radical SAM/GNAT enzyme Elp3 [Nanoarchaeota archaeon]MBU1004763.1 tRNA uridine(34) 5-carboxymethylaminomethyl modification radical SAM/GNAT enzyme Elp3 [Nanoarchaeota archaeon]MBU1946622.1 tRNA uridine(34) 5-carboxymethylaminomethyl modification radical SAM/GNAT enzyme Elp3 [Nanoarchaeota archaeon]
MKNFIKEIIELIKKQKPSKANLSNIKAKLCKKYKLKNIPTDIEILLNAPIAEIPKIKKYIITKPTRTISGVSVCAIMTKPFKCPHVKKGIGPCIMCPGGPKSVFGNVPQSYTGKEPATRRAIRNNYNPYLQVMNRLEQHVVQGHTPDKLELIIMGGTFPSFPKKYQESFITDAFKAMNDFSSMFFTRTKKRLKGVGGWDVDIIKFKNFFELPGNIFDEKRTAKIHKKLTNLQKNRKTTLEKFQSKALKGYQTCLIREQLKNEKSNIRCVSLVIETRPDYATLKEADEMLRLGCTKVELGAQTIYNDVLKKIKRGHTVEDTINSTKILKDLGFKINYHMMLGLPGVNKEKDLFALQALFAFEDFQPDMLKLYPCMVLKGTKLYDLWKRKKYKPLTTNQAAEIISEFKSIVPEYCRIMRVQRDIPTFMTEAGVDKTNLRQYVGELMKKKKIKCNCIRCREPKLNKISKQIQIHERHYLASGGNEFFISAEDTKNNLILGFCRLRFPSQSLRQEITEDSALIRELHVYGEAIQIGKQGRIQHKGIGKALVNKAESTAKTYYKKKMVVIAGIGAREYFKKLRYRKEGHYMVKKL